MLIRILNICIEKSNWPDALKKSEAIPLYKADRQVHQTTVIDPSH